MFSIHAGTIVLPEVASGPGMFPSLLVFIGMFKHFNTQFLFSLLQIFFIKGVYIVNVLSGIVIGELSIQQYENSKSPETSVGSFKALAEGMLDSEAGGIAIGWISIIINWCILAFGLKRAGSLVQPCLTYFSSFFPSLDLNVIVGVIATFLASLVFIQSENELSHIASKAGTVLSASFIAVLVSGLMSMQENPMFIPGTESNTISAVCYAAPIFLTAMVYQNIVPIVAKLVDYDRFKLNSSLILGSGLPLMMYLGYCLATLGGGISLDASSSTSTLGAYVPLLLNVFFYSAVIASTIACSISLCEEFQSLLASKDEIDPPQLNDPDIFTLSLPDDSNTSISDKLQSTVYAIFPPFVAVALFSHSDTFKDALSFAGSYFSPILYGILPVLLATKLGPDTNIPGGKGTLAILGVSTIVFMGLQLANDIGISM